MEMQKKRHPMSRDLPPEHYVRMREIRLAKAPTPEQRFWAKVDKDAPGGCWLWTGHRDRGGYGQVWFRERPRAAHRVALEILFAVQPPQDRDIDHLCRKRACVNPAHLRAATERQNALENNGSPFAQNAAKTHCIRGHAFTPENTSTYTVKARKNRYGTVYKGGPTRICLACKRERYKRSKERATLGKGASR